MVRKERRRPRGGDSDDDEDVLYVRDGGGNGRSTKCGQQRAAAAAKQSTGEGGREEPGKERSRERWDGWSPGAGQESFGSPAAVPVQVVVWRRGVAAIRAGLPLVRCPSLSVLVLLALPGGPRQRKPRSEEWCALSLPQLSPARDGWTVG